MWIRLTNLGKALFISNIFFISFFIFFLLRGDRLYSAILLFFFSGFITSFLVWFSHVMDKIRKNKIEKDEKNRIKHSDIDPLGEENWD